MSYFVLVAIAIAVCYYVRKAALDHAQFDVSLLRAEIAELEYKLETAQTQNERVEETGHGDVFAENSSLRIEVSKLRARIIELESANKHLETRINRMHARGLSE